MYVWIKENGFNNQNQSWFKISYKYYKLTNHMHIAYIHQDEFYEIILHCLALH